MNNAGILVLLLSFVILITTIIFVFLGNVKVLKHYIGHRKLRESTVEPMVNREHHIDLLTNSNFSPYCCPSVYSNSTGCLCYDNDEDKIIIRRGGNKPWTRYDEIAHITRQRPLSKQP